MSLETAIDAKRALRAARFGELKRFAQRFFRNPLGVVGLAIVLLLLFTAPSSPTSSPRTIPICRRCPTVSPRPARNTGSAPMSSDAISIRASSTARA